MAIALDQKRAISHDGSNRIEFPVVEIASAIGWDSGTVKQHLKSLEWCKGKCYKVLFVIVTTLLQVH
jgi:hypothetical protein